MDCAIGLSHLLQHVHTVDLLRLTESFGLQKIMNFIELPHIKQTYRLSSLVLHDGLLIYQGTRGNVYGIFRMKRYDSFVKFSIKKLFINTIGRYNLDIEEDYNV